MDKESNIKDQAIDLFFRHFVVITSKEIIFASAEDKRNGKLYNFIIGKNTGEVMEQVNEHFEKIYGERAKFIREMVEEKFGIIPTFKTRDFDFN